MMMNEKDLHNPRSTFSARWATILGSCVIALAVIATPLVGTARAENDVRTDDRPAVRTDPDVKTNDRREHEREHERIPREKKTKATPLFSENFDDAKLKSRKWYDMTRIRIADGAMAGKGCIEYEWIDKKSKSQASSSMRHLFKPTDKIYIRFYLKLSKGWGWTGRNYHPHLVHFLTTENPKYHGPAASHLTLYVEPVNSHLRLAATDIQNKNMPHGLTQGRLKGGYNGKFYDSKKVLFKDDKWHCIEAYFKLNTLDLKNDRPNKDGIVRGWFDGKLVVEHTDVILRSTDFPKMKFNQFLMAPYFGPGLLPHAQKLWIDELVVGTNRIGPIPMRRTPARERRRAERGEGREKHERGERREDNKAAKNIRRCENKVADLEEILEKAEENLKRLIRLHKEGRADEGAVEKAEKRFKEIRERLHDARAELRKLRKAAQARRTNRTRERGERPREKDREGRDRRERKGDVEELREQIRHLQRQLEQAEQKLKRLERERHEDEERGERKEHREHEED